MRLQGDRRSWITFSTLIAGFCYLAWLTGSAITVAKFGWDDNFISYRYSRSLAEGHGLRYNIDDPNPTEGFSSLAHVLVVALGFRFRADPLVVTRGLSLLCFLLVPLALGLALAKILKAPVLDALAVSTAVQFLYFLTPVTPYHLHIGMDTLLFMGSVACLAAWSLGELASGRTADAAIIPQALFGCAAVTLVVLGRPEGPLLVLLTLAMIPLARRYLFGLPWSRQSRPFLVVCGWTGIGLVVYLAWKQWYFGDILPNPYYVKAHNAIMGSRSVLFPGWPETRAFLAFLAPWVALALPLVAAARARRDAIMALLVVSVPGVAMVLIYALVIHEAAFGYRYEYPFLVYLNLLLGGTACLLMGRVRYGASFLLVALAIGATCTKYPRTIVHGKPARFLHLQVDDSESILVEIGKDLARTQLGKRATIALSAAGAIPYLSGFRAVDIVGLNDSYLCGREQHSIQEVWAYIDSYKPDILQSGLPPATPGVGRDRFDPVLDAPLFSDIRRHGFGSELTEYYDQGKILESMRREMIYIRDQFVFGAVYSTGRNDWVILYLRRDSPHLNAIQQALLSNTRRMDRTTDLSRYFGNDPRGLH